MLGSLPLGPDGWKDTPFDVLAFYLEPGDFLMGETEIPFALVSPKGLRIRGRFSMEGDEISMLSVEEPTYERLRHIPLARLRNAALARMAPDAA